MESRFLSRFLERLGRIPPEQVEAVVRQLAAERDWRDEVLESLEEGILLVGGDGRVRWHNGAFPRLAGFDRKPDLAGLPVAEAFVWEELKALARERAAEGGPLRQRDLLVAGRRARWLAVSVFPLRTGEPARDGAAVWVLADRTDSERKSEDRRQAAKIASLATLTAGIAHEIKNPLNSLTIHAQLLQKAVAQLPPEAATGEARERMERSAAVFREEIARLTRIVEEFLTAVRPIQPRFQRMDVNDVLLDVARLVGPECHAHGIELLVEPDTEAPPMRIDPELLKQALLNLARNAVEAIVPQASAEGRAHRIALRTVLRQDHLLLEVEDTGPGIPEADHLRIFEPYHTTKFNGTGLGLMIVYRNVQAHDGAIGLTSRPGEGTIFHIGLPLDERPVRLLGAAEIKAAAAEPAGFPAPE
ncbi:MAG: ATP-binding protein [Candidatus Sumerlaeia bacterium]|nr:ATP-binding protein [Candidatus Sumerlaeia bacterium]